MHSVLEFAELLSSQRVPRDSRICHRLSAAISAILFDINFNNDLLHDLRFSIDVTWVLQNLFLCEIAGGVGPCTFDRVVFTTTGYDPLSGALQ
jgi:hypothetical protein